MRYQIYDIDAIFQSLLDIDTISIIIFYWDYLHKSDKTALCLKIYCTVNKVLGIRTSHMFLFKNTARSSLIADFKL